MIATSEELFQRIQKVHSGQESSMAESLDYQYTNSVLDQPRDGMVYLSEAFILKLVSPQYRLNSARRLASIEALASGQYLVWAYRSLLTKWPSSLSELVNEGYISQYQPNIEQLSVQADGVLVDANWGSLWDLQSLSTVPIDNVSKQEKTDYENFRDNYQQYWSTYFDPIGIGFKVDETLSFHTIILPLIENSEYRRLEELSSGEKISFDAIDNIVDLSPFSIHSRFNYNEILHLSVGRPRRGEDEANLTLEEQAEFQKRANESLNKELEANPPIDFFSLFGDEIAFFLIDDQELKASSPESSGCLGIELRNVSEFQRSIELVMVDSPGESLGLREHSGIEYTIAPFIFDSKLYIVYHDSFAYVLAKENATQAFCEKLSKIKPVSNAFPGQQRIGIQHNALVRADFRNSNFLDRLLHEGFSNGRYPAYLRDITGYLSDLEILEKTLQSPESATRQLPTHFPDFFGVTASRSLGSVFLNDVPVNEINFSSYQANEEGELAIEALFQKSESKNHVREALAPLEWFNVSLDFTPEGLSTHVLINYPREVKNSFISNEMY